MSQKILPRKKLQKVIRALQSAGKKVVFTNGCFDIIHAGHVRYLRKARSLGDLMVVGLNSDKSVRKLKGRGRPLVKEADRAELLAALEMVDYVTVFGEDTPASLIKALRPNVLVKGGDYRVGEVVGRETVEASGGRVAIVPFVRGRSTTALIKKICGASHRR